MSKRGWTGLSSRHNLGLTLLFGMGSVHWYLSIMGEVWFVSQICTVTFVILASWLAVANRSPWLSGVALVLAMLGRPTIAFSWPLLLGIAAQDLKDRSETSSIEWRRWLKWTVASAIPLVLALVALLIYNFLRFDNLTDFGYVAQNVNPRLVASLREYGQFNLYYLGANLDAMLLALPRIDLAAKVFEPDLRGMSLLLTMPALIYLVRARKASPLVSGTWTALALLLVPLLTYYNTGWAQFGYRFSLDFIVPIIILLAIGAGKRLSWTLTGAIIWGIAINGWGAFWFLTNQFH